MEDQAIGKVLAGKYRIDGFLKRGGMGAVYRGTHLMLNKPVAIKLIKPELVTSEDTVRRFQLEARAASQLDHPNIVTIYDLGRSDDGSLYIAMELVNGKSLKEAVKAEGPFEPKRAVGIARAIASALTLAHGNKIIHRDLKPQNIMLALDNEGHENPKLLDFGIAKSFETDSPALTSTGMILGTPQYMSPEQAEGKSVDARADLYALGIILYEMLVGKVPFDSPSVPAILVKHLKEPPQPPSSLRGDIAPALEAIVLRCLAKEPSERFASADDLSRALGSTAETVSRVEEGPTVGIPALSTVPYEAATKISTVQASAPARQLPPIPPTVSQPSEAPIPDVTVRSPHTRSSAWKWGVLAIGVLAAAAVVIALLNRGEQDTQSRSASMALSQPQSGIEPQTNEELPSAESEDSIGSGDQEPTEPLVSKPAPPVTAETSQGGSAPSATVESSQGSLPKAAEPVPPPPLSPKSVETQVQGMTAPLPVVPSVSMSCDGVPDACAAITSALQAELDKRGLPVTQFEPSEIEIVVFAEEVEARQEEQFGTLLVVRTYSIEVTGKAPRFRELVAMPPPETMSFDARFGKEKLNERSRVIASNVSDKIQAYWTKKKR